LIRQAQVKVFYVDVQVRQDELIFDVSTKIRAISAPYKSTNELATLIQVTAFCRANLFKDFKFFFNI